MLQCNGLDCFIGEFEALDERRVGFEKYGVFLAEFDEGGLGVPWMKLDLIDGRETARKYGGELL